MVQPLGLPGEVLAEYTAALGDPGVVTTSVDVLDMDGGHVTSLTGEVRHGQVLVDRHADATRVLRLWVDDPGGSLSFDVDAPTPTAVGFENMLQVHVHTPVSTAPQGVVSVAVFTGPVVVLDRDTERVYLEAHGKEVLTRAPAWTATTVPRGTPKSTAIQLLLEAAGETLVDVPTVTEPLARDVSVDRYDDRWATAAAVAGSVGLQLLYRGDGTCTARVTPTVPVWRFTTVPGDTTGDGTVTGPARVRRTRVVNTVEVLGPLPPAGQTRVRAVAALPDGHPLSPARLTRGGVPGVAPVRQVVPGLRSAAQAGQVADTLLRDLGARGVEPRFNAVPVYHLDEGDPVELLTTGEVVPFTLDRFSLPLGAARVMTVGHLTRTTPGEGGR